MLISFESSFLVHSLRHSAVPVSQILTLLSLTAILLLLLLSHFETKLSCVDFNYLCECGNYTKITTKHGPFSMKHGDNPEIWEHVKKLVSKQGTLTKKGSEWGVTLK